MTITHQRSLLIVYTSLTEFWCRHDTGSSDECGWIKHFSQNSAVIKCRLITRIASSSLLSLSDEEVMVTYW